MLDKLLEYGRQKGIVSKPGYASKTALWAIALDYNGCFLEILHLGEATGRRPCSCIKLL
jgi:hypothetical protein